MWLKCTFYLAVTIMETLVRIAYLEIQHNQIINQFICQFINWYLVDSAGVKEFVELRNSPWRENGEVDPPFSHFDDEALGGETGVAQRIPRRNRIRSRVADQDAILLHFTLHTGSTVSMGKNRKGANKGRNKEPRCRPGCILPCIPGPRWK